MRANGSQGMLLAVACCVPMIFGAGCASTGNWRLWPGKQAASAEATDDGPSVNTNQAAGAAPAAHPNVLQRVEFHPVP